MDKTGKTIEELQRENELLKQDKEQLEITTARGQSKAICGQRAY